MIELRTARLLLREWRDEDLAPFAKLNADPQVMRYFPAVLDRSASDAMAVRIRARLAVDGWGLWAVEVPGVAPFIGFVGLARPRFESHFAPGVEVGWRLARTHWGRGYAPEAAREALRFGFADLGLDEIVSFTTTANLPSRRVMEKIGMSRDPSDDFEHPDLPPGHPKRVHVLYRLARDRWTALTRLR